MPTILIDAILWVSGFMFVYMTIWFIIALMTKRNDVADFAWGMGFILVAVCVFTQYGFEFDRGLLVTILVIIWGLRLSFYVFKRNFRKPEDRRYAAWRLSWGKWFVLRSYLQVFVLQGILLLLIVTPVLIVNVFNGGGITLFDIAGFCIWILGFYFETVGDKQLKTFISNPQNKGKILDTGLWKYTRHPNYFGEVTQWWGIWIISMSVPYGVLGIIGPLTITFLILMVSGIPMLEKTMAQNPLFEEYRKKTSAFIPWSPRK